MGSFARPQRLVLLGPERRGIGRVTRRRPPPSMLPANNGVSLYRHPRPSRHRDRGCPGELLLSSLGFFEVETYSLGQKAARKSHLSAPVMLCTCRVSWGEVL